VRFFLKESEMSRLLRVLIVEDSEDDAFSLLRELRRGGYEIISDQVYSANAMSAALDRQPWDLIISDHAMPGFSALSALAILKDRALDLPFIIVSGNMSEEVAVTAMKAGAHDFFVKGNVARLIPAIERELTEAAVRSERKRAERRLAAQHAVTTILAESTALNEATPEIVQAICENLGWEIGAIWRVDPAENVLRFVELWQTPASGTVEFKTSLQQITFAPGVGLPGRIWLTRRPAWIPDVMKDAHFPRPALAAQLGLHGAFAFPIQLGNDFLGVIEFFSRQIQPPDDELLSMFASISSQIGQAIERRRTEAHLRESEARNRAILESLPDIVFVVDARRKILFFNPAAGQLLGNLNLNQELPREVQEIVEQVMEKGVDHVPADFNQTYRARIQNEDRFFLPRVVAMHAKSGAVFGVVVLLQDVTALRLLDQVKSNLIATVSHELKTPVTGLRMALNVLLEGTVGPLNSPQQEMVAIADAESERLLKTLNSLLDLARFEEGLPSIYMENASPLELAQSAIGEASSAARSKSVTINVESDEALPRLRVDRVRIVHVFTNLLTNAIKHSSKGETILFRVTKREEQSVRFSVIDHGPGIPTAYQPRIFDKFFRVPGQTKAGTGLGLTIAKEFVKAHHGSIGVTSELGQGSTFYVDLPLPTGAPASK
jgi:PAS domain S-box-containing protein